MSRYVMRGDARAAKLQRYHLIMGLTKACGFGKCRQCYVEGIRKDDSGSMPMRTMKRVLGEFAAIANKESEERPIAHFKGGEPLDVPEKLEELSKFASGLGLDVFVTTNGLSLVERMDMLERIRDRCSGLRVTLSLNGSKPEIDAILRVDLGIFDATIKSAEALSAAGITFDINHIVHCDNLHDLPAMLELARGLGAAQLNVLQLILAGRAADGLRKAEPDQMLSTLTELYRSDDERAKGMLAGSLPEAIEGMRTGRCARACVAGFRGLLYINPQGKAYSCPSTFQESFLAGHVESSSVEELMSSDALRRLRELDISPGCKGDALSGGEGAKRLRQAIKELAGDGDGHEAICIQKNF